VRELSAEQIAEMQHGATTTSQNARRFREQLKANRPIPRGMTFSVRMYRSVIFE
jgi:hypothetical protein